MPPIVFEALAVPVVVVSLNILGRWLLRAAQSGGADIATTMFVLSVLMIFHATDVAKLVEASSRIEAATPSAAAAPAAETQSKNVAEAGVQASPPQRVMQWYFFMMLVNPVLWFWSVLRIEKAFEAEQHRISFLPTAELTACGGLGIFLNAAPFLVAGMV